MRFHLDEHVSHAIAQALRMRGIDVTTTGDAGLLGASDEQHIEYAHRTGRVIYTHDADFLNLHQQGVSHSGIVFDSSEVRTVGETVRFLCLMHDCLESDEMVGKIEFV